MSESTSLWAANVLTPEGWQKRVRIDIGIDGHIKSIRCGVDATSSDRQFQVLLPAPCNLHSHAFQRAMAGMTEARGPDPSDSFWTWRRLMYRFLENLSPDDVESISALVQMEMLEAGYAAVGEFHYLHHQPSGKTYSSLIEMSERIMAATANTGIGLTLLPVMYEHGGCDGRELRDGQRRFGCTLHQYSNLLCTTKQKILDLPADSSVGVAPHSLRAVRRETLRSCIELAADTPFHLHVAEQIAEVDEIEAAWGARPVSWLLNEHEVSSNWCLIHATQMLRAETVQLARTDAVVGLCPITESNLGDGIFDGVSYQKAGGLLGVGSDSNVRISLSEELRTLEYSQRLREKGRAMFSEQSRSTGRVLFDSVLAGGSRALQRNSGAIEVGRLGDLFALDVGSGNMLAVQNDRWLDAWIFAGDDSLVTDVWSAGRHVVKEGSHIDRRRILRRYDQTLRKLAEVL